jgi:hypothetical protein
MNKMKKWICDRNVFDEGYKLFGIFSITLINPSMLTISTKKDWIIPDEKRSSGEKFEFLDDDRQFSRVYVTFYNCLFQS